MADDNRDKTSLTLAGVEWVGGWAHADGTLCPEYLAPVGSAPERGWWCTTHQMHVHMPDDRDPLSAELAAIIIRRRHATARYAEPIDIRESSDDVPRLVKALEAALNHHQPEQLYAMVEDFKGKVVCPHSPGYDGDLHFEADDGEWHCKALPTVVVCSSCADGSASDLREQWPCPTYTDITSALTGKAATVV